MIPPERPQAITKELSANDTGATGGHQAGIHIPKHTSVLSFFPELDSNTKNPRVILEFIDEYEQRWEFAFIYYNNLFFGGTRNEYRLTRMTPFIRKHGLQPGDRVTLCRNPTSELLLIKCQKANVSKRNKSGVLKLGSSWKEIKI